MTSATEQQASARISLQNQAYNAAWRTLRDKYRQEYDALIDAEFEKRGLERRKRATSEERAARIKQEKLEKARARAKQILTDYPELRDQPLF